ncbi:MAG: oligoendopeptidase F, partial [Methylobacterium sp.]
MRVSPAAPLPAVMAEGADAARAAAKAADLGQILGPLPEWDLTDLYGGLDDPNFSTDLTRAEEECRQFNESYAGKITGLATGPDASARLAEAVATYERIEDLLGKLMSYAGLVYSGDTTDETRAKFYGDTRERLTNASGDLLFFGLELNRVDDATLDAAKAREPLSRYAPWIDDLRREKPFQLEDRIEKLFLEKSVTANAAWDRLFDETIASLRFTVQGERLSLEPTLNKLQDPDGTVRKEAAGAISEVLRTSLRVFTLITNTLAKDKEISDRWRGFRDVADARHLSNRVEPEVVAALVDAVQAAYPRLSHRYYKLKAKWFGQETLPYWDRNA